MGRSAVITVHLTLLAATLLAGCGASEEADPPSPTPATSTLPTPTQVTSPKPPVMPPKARQHTEEGAKAFVEYYFAVANYSRMSLDLTLLAPLAADGCRGCQGAVQSIRDVAALRGRVSGGLMSVSDLAATRLGGNQIRPMQVDFTVISGPEAITYPEGQPTSHPGGSARLRFVLTPRDKGWTVGYWGAPT